MARMTSAAVSAKNPGPDCPLCGKPRRIAHKPFCSSTCTELDLGRWLGGTYVIATQDPDDDAAEG